MRTRAATRDTTARQTAILVRALMGALVLLALAATTLVAQQVRELSLEEAIRLAKHNNPAFLSTANDQEPADWAVRAAYGNLIPTATASGSMGYTEAGVQRYGTVDLGTQSTDWYSSSYRLGLSWTMNGSTLFGVSTARAASKATAAGIDNAEFNLESQVTLQYMTALRARDAVDVARDTYERAQQNRDIVDTRVQTGAAAGTEGRQAEVDQGRAEVALLQAERLYRAELLRLQEQMGTAMDDSLALVSEFQIFEPTWTRDELLDDAMRRHPSLEAMRAQEASATARVRQARSSYFPSVTVSTGLAGFTQQALNKGFVVQQARNARENQVSSCKFYSALATGLSVPLEGTGLEDYPKDCSQFAYTPADSIAALASNSAFPMDFTKNPISVSLSVSIPIFQGFSRQQQVEQAAAARKDADNNLRAEELRLRTAVTQALDNLQSAYRQVQIETRNQDLAEQQLVQARQRYAVGNTSILELMDAQTSLSTAQRDYLNAVYGFHQSLVQLEAATGRSLRPGRGDDDDADGAEG